MIFLLPLDLTRERMNVFLSETSIIYTTKLMLTLMPAKSVWCGLVFAFIFIFKLVCGGVCIYYNFCVWLCELFFENRVLNFSFNSLNRPHINVVTNVKSISKTEINGGKIYRNASPHTIKKYSF